MDSTAHAITSLGLAATTEVVAPPPTNTVDLVLRVATWIVSTLPLIVNIFKKQKAKKNA